MKGLRIERWCGQLAQTRHRLAAPAVTSVQYLSRRGAPRLYSTEEALAKPSVSTVGPPTKSLNDARSRYPSPLPEKALESAKLSALHARLCLPGKLPLQTLARTLVDRSADPNPDFNNERLVLVGKAIVGYHTCEWLVAKYPRLPMAVVFEAMAGYAGPQSLYEVAKGWGVENTMHPGGEVDPGYLQWTDDPTLLRKQDPMSAQERPEVSHDGGDKYRRGWSSRVVYDDEFGAPLVDPAGQKARPSIKIPDEIVAERRREYEISRNTAYGSFVRALVGAMYLHAGREMAKSFVRAHLLSRTLEIDAMFRFRAPLLELAKLCAREGFERPVARLESETGRLSRSPVFVVGIYSGKDKLGEGVGHSLNFARWKAGMNALKAWYLYSPGPEPRVPSDMFTEGAKPWQPPYIDIGELILDSP